MPRGGQLPVVGDDGGDRIPVHLRARHVVRFEMIGVQLDQAGHDQVAAGVLAACRRIALAELGDAAVGEGDPAALDHAVGQHDAGVAEDGLVPCRSHHLFLHAAAANDVTSTIRSAIRWRISSSWTIATMATPWRFFSLDQLDHDGAIGRVERGGRLVQQQDRQIGDEAARDVDALLLAAGEGRRRQRPQPLGNVEPAQQRAGLLARLRARDAVRDQRLGHHVDRGDARHRAQELADIADGRRGAR